MGQRILVIDDEEPLLDLMRAALGNEGYDVQCANSGALGLEMYQAQRPDLLIVDIAMPEVNGYHVIDTIRNLEGETVHTPIVILTAFPESVVNRDLDDEGADLRLTKPIAPSELIAFIKRLLQ